MVIDFWVSGIPKALSVGRSVRVPNKGGGFRQFQTRRNTEWASLIGDAGQQHRPPVPWSNVGVSLTITFYLPRPASAPKKVMLPLKRPDLDNLAHKLTDRWNGVFWTDDSIVVDLTVRKRFAPSGATGVAVRVMRLNANGEPEP